MKESTRIRAITSELNNFRTAWKTTRSAMRRQHFIRMKDTMLRRDPRTLSMMDLTQR